jgi:hypothetical protein
MKIQERYLWILGIILSGFFVQNQSHENKTLNNIISTYELESNIQDAQIMDFSQSLSVVSSEEYSKGFEAGRSQAGIAFANGRPMLGYTDGYHAALDQFDPDYINVEKTLLKELDEDIVEIKKREVDPFHSNKAQ